MDIVGAKIDRDVHFDEFLKVLKREGTPRYLSFYEHFATNAFMEARLPAMKDARGTPRYWELYAEFYLSLGYDCIPLERPLRYGKIERKESFYHSEEGTCIESMEDFEKLAWPDEEAPIDFEPFEIIEAYIPDNIKMVAGVSGGPYEASTLSLLGVMGLSYALADQPELVRAVFDKLKALYISANRRLAAMDGVGATRQGDDLGFKTGTFMPPDILREYVFPIYKGMADEAHVKDKPFVLHSCHD